MKRKLGVYFFDISDTIYPILQYLRGPYRLIIISASLQGVYLNQFVMEIPYRDDQTSKHHYIYLSFSSFVTMLKRIAWSDSVSVCKIEQQRKLFSPQPKVRYDRYSEHQFTEVPRTCTCTQESSSWRKDERSVDSITLLTSGEREYKRSPLFYCLVWRNTGATAIGVEQSDSHALEETVPPNQRQPTQYPGVGCGVYASQSASSWGFPFLRFFCCGLSNGLLLWLASYDVLHCSVIGEGEGVFIRIKKQYYIQRRRTAFLYM